jgi:hypothetical protein
MLARPLALIGVISFLVSACADQTMNAPSFNSQEPRLSVLKIESIDENGDIPRWPLHRLDDEIGTVITPFDSIDYYREQAGLRKDSLKDPNAIALRPGSLDGIAMNCENSVQVASNWSLFRSFIPTVPRWIIRSRPQGAMVVFAGGVAPSQTDVVIVNMVEKDLSNIRLSMGGYKDCSYGSNGSYIEETRLDDQDVKIFTCNMEKL